MSYFYFRQRVGTNLKRAIWDCAPWSWSYEIFSEMRRIGSETQLGFAVSCVWDQVTEQMMEMVNKKMMLRNTMLQRVQKRKIQRSRRRNLVVRFVVLYLLEYLCDLGSERPIWIKNHECLYTCHECLFCVLSYWNPSTQSHSWEEGVESLDQYCLELQRVLNSQVLHKGHLKIRQEVSPPAAL